jgi:hypothetical protein
MTEKRQAEDNSVWRRSSVTIRLVMDSLVCRCAVDTRRFAIVQREGSLAISAVA